MPENSRRFGPRLERPAHDSQRRVRALRRERRAPVDGRCVDARNTFDLLEHAIDCTGGHLADARTLAEAGRESEFPGAFAELERQQQMDRGGRHRGRCRLRSVGRGLHRYALLVEWNLKEA